MASPSGTSASGDERALAAAMRVFELLEMHARDRMHGGYLEALSRNWGSLADTALSDKDLSVPKSMNTNLHVLEAYTTLLRVTRDSRVAQALHELLRVSLDHIVALRPFAHCDLFFDLEWNSQVDTVSYGHDIEASWLLVGRVGGARGGGDRRRSRWPSARAQSRCVLPKPCARTAKMPTAASCTRARLTGVVNDQKHWWPQAEGVVGWLNAYQLAGRAEDRAAALAAWDFIEARVIDREHGEWFAELNRDGSVRYGAEGDVKIGPWKCPYHNARACLQVLRRVE